MCLIYTFQQFLSHFQAVDFFRAICYTTSNRIPKAMTKKADGMSSHREPGALKTGGGYPSMLWLPSRASEQGRFPPVGCSANAASVRRASWESIRGAITPRNLSGTAS